MKTFRDENCALKCKKGFKKFSICKYRYTGIFYEYMYIDEYIQCARGIFYHFCCSLVTFVCTLHKSHQLSKKGKKTFSYL